MEVWTRWEGGRVGEIWEDGPCDFIPGCQAIERHNCTLSTGEAEVEMEGETQPEGDKRSALECGLVTVLTSALLHRFPQTSSTYQSHVIYLLDLSKFTGLRPPAELLRNNV